MSLRAQVLHSLKWLAAGRMVGQTAAWGITLVVIRLLNPSDYGLMALANVMIGFVDLFREMGLYTAMVQRRALSKRQIEQSFGLLILGNSLMYALLYLAAPGIAWLFGEPRLVAIVRVLGLQFPIASIGVVQDAMLARDMKFKAKSFVNLATLIANGLVTLGCAFAGFGVWSLVAGSLTGALARTVGLLVAARYWCRPRFSWQDMGAMARFSGYVTVNSVLWYLYSRTDVVIIGKLLGQHVLGFYAVAFQLAAMPMQKLSGLINQVGLAAYASVQDDLAVVRSHFFKVIRLVSFFAFPVFFGISSVAPELVDVALGQQWQAATLPLRILSLVMPLRMISNAGSPTLEAIGRPEIGTGNLLIAFVIMPPAFFVGAYYGGLVGVSLTWVIAFPVLVLIRLSRSLPAIGARMAPYFTSMMRPAAGAAVMYGAVLAARPLVAQPYLGPITGLIFLIGTGALTYTACMALACQAQCREIIALAR